MPGPTATPTPVYDQYTQLLLRRAALQAELQARPNDRALLDQLAVVEQQLGELQAQIARSPGPGAPGPTPATAPGGPPAAPPASGLDGQLSQEQLMQLLAPTLGVQQGRLDLDRQEFAYKMWVDAQEALRQQTQDAWQMFVDRLGGGNRAGVTYGQALPYMVAPGVEFVPGFEPGGPVEMLYGRYGLRYDPNQWRTAQIPAQGAAVSVAPASLPSWAP